MPEKAFFAATGVASRESINGLTASRSMASRRCRLFVSRVFSASNDCLKISFVSLAFSESAPLVEEHAASLVAVRCEVC